MIQNRIMKIIQVDENTAHLVYELFDKYRVFYKQSSNIELAKRFINERLAGSESIIFVALTEEDGIPSGFTQLYPKYSSMRVSKNWILNDLYVRVEYRKQGIGAQLIERAISFAQQNGASFVELSTAVDNYTAQSLYEQIGFVKKEPDVEFIDYKVLI